ncbi:MAG: prolipoprotein diacylglyceryl transferase [Candidatus Berkelbacteria bacterium]|nr:MAG: prolipoprotein diacylglyceryl transferase [Candidatus Berkelbacteria bacterium]QQG52002.1 MAG: prolipoprotein diacylglyceryl transferase [Candidatus Berkelbacteria bacterium]
MYPVLFSIGKFKLYSFGSFIALGAIVAGVFLYRAARHKKLPTQQLFDIVLYSLLAGLIGARIGYYALYHDQFQSFWQVFYFWQGGLVSLTGLLAGFAAYLYFLRRDKLSNWVMLDIGLLSLLYGWGVGKFGCHLSSCTVGRAGNFLALNGTYPVDLYGSLLAMGLATALSVIWAQSKLREGVIFFLAIEGFLLSEFLIKTLKADFGEGIAQFEAISYLTLIVAVYAIFWFLHGPKVSSSGAVSNFKNILLRRR